MPPKPNTAAISARIKNIKAQYNILCLLIRFLYYFLPFITMFKCINQSSPIFSLYLTHMAFFLHNNSEAYPHNEKSHYRQRNNFPNYSGFEINISN
jgi:hypothetical protein